MSFWSRDKAKGPSTRSEGSTAPVAYYEARSTIAGPCGHRHNSIGAAEKCARSFAAAHRRKNPECKHTYWHVASVDGNGVRKRLSEDI